jgi:hypothetical protein
MAFLGFDTITLSAVGLSVVIIGGVVFLLAAALSLLGVILTLIYRRSRTILIPNITLFIMGFLEAPVKQLAWLFGIDESFLDQMVVEIRNILYYRAYCNTPYSERMLFLPQCLRNPKCPAPLEPEGLICKSCGRCGICRIKEYAEQLGYRVFIAPGSMLVKRMVKRYKPKAVLGIGCTMEVYEGARLMASFGLPVQGVILDRDGCVNTRVNVDEVLEKIKVNRSLGRNYSINNDPELLKLAESISAMWDDSQPSEFDIVEAQGRTERGAW